LWVIIEISKERSFTVKKTALDIYKRSLRDVGESKGGNVKWKLCEVSISVVKGSEGLIRMYIHHIRITVYMAISFIILLYTALFLFCIVVYKVVRFL
jgi:hypothetical protein